MGDAAPAAMEVEVLPSAALDAAEAERVALMRSFEDRRAARALAVPTAEADARAGLRSFGQPVCLFGEDLLDRRERLRAAMARAGRGDGGGNDDGGDGDDGGDDDGGDVGDGAAGRAAAPPPPPPPEEEYYVEGTEELRALRMALAMPSLERARRRLAAERDLRATHGSRDAVKSAFQASEAATVESVRGGTIVASQVGNTRPLSAISLGPRPGRPAAGGGGGGGGGDWIVATGSWGGAVKLWGGGADAELLQTLDRHTARVSSVCMPHEHRGVLLTASADATAHMYVARDGGDGAFAHAASFAGHARRVADCRMHPVRRSLVVTASFDGRFILHDDGRPLLAQVTGHEEVYRTAFHPDGSLLATCGTEGGVRLWDLRSGRAVMTMARAHVGAVTSLDFSGDGRVLASGGGDHMVRVWELRAKRCAAALPAHVGLVSGVRLAGGGGDVLVSASFDRSVKMWTARRGWALLKAHAGHEDKVTAVDCTPDARWVVSACYDRTFKIWGAEGGG
jgi:U4/U6 small nuclear ribonucleoprotein PRP4